MAVLTVIRAVNDGISQLTNSENVESGQLRIITETIPPGTDQALTYSFTNSKLKAFYAKSDVALSIKTNSTSAPQETLNLAAGVGYVWTVSGSAIGAIGTSPFAGNVTSIFVTNAGATGTLNIRDVTDPS